MVSKRDNKSCSTHAALSLRIKADVIPKLLKKRTLACQAMIDVCQVLAGMAYTGGKENGTRYIYIWIHAT